MKERERKSSKEAVDLKVPSADCVMTEGGPHPSQELSHMDVGVQGVRHPLLPSPALAGN